MYAGKHPGSSGMRKEDVQRKLEDEVNRVVEAYGINPLIGMPGVNMHQDTPTEILHTILLGVVKYFWGQTVHILDKKKAFSTFQVRLASVDTSGLNIPKISAEYICAYKGSLIGKHFKSLAQLMPFLIYDLVPGKVLDAWTIIGELIVLIWHTEIEDREVYLCKLSATIEAFLNITAECSPSILISKPKFHFLVHLPAYIRRFGPALIFSTERYKSFNHVFRLTCIHSNRQAPSRDSCKAFASQDITKHIVTGGSWIDRTTGEWAHAGQKVLAYMRDDKHFRKLLAIPGDANDTPPGHARIASTGHEHGRPEALTWTATNVYASLNLGDPSFCPLANEEFLPAISLIAKNGDQVRHNSFAAINYQDKTHVGRVQEILVTTAKPWMAVVVTLELFEFSPNPHECLHMPVITPSAVFCVINPAEILCALNVQHDCYSGDCVSYKETPVRQERQLTSLSRSIVDHSNTPFYILNTHSLHNYSIISGLLPTNLTLNLRRATMSAEDQKVLCERAAAHIRSRKAGEAENQSDADFWETLPFEQPCGRGRGHSRRQAQAQRGHGAPSRGGGSSQQQSTSQQQNASEQQNAGQPSGRGVRLQRSDLDPRIGKFSLHPDELAKRSRMELWHMCIWYDLK
ncbi:hypothetical protein PM082_005083 [Marasmius tenuissimus]|nr:hypothetical protein PM082_005083 [Marasmius tenuissimus]